LDVYCSEKWQSACHLSLSPTLPFSLSPLSPSLKCSGIVSSCEMERGGGGWREREHPPTTSGEGNSYRCSGIVSSCERDRGGEGWREREHLFPTTGEENSYKCRVIVSSCEWNLASFRYNPILFFIESWGTFLSIHHKVLSNTE